VIAAISTLQLIGSPQWHKANDQNSNDAMKNRMSAKMNVLVRQRTKTCAGVNDGGKICAPDGSKTPPGLQDFKGFNDLYGHSAGDDAPAAVAQCIGEKIRRPGDTAARYGGEEFAVLLPNTGAAGTVQVAETMRAAVQALDRRHVASPHHIVTISIGVACTSERRFATLRAFPSCDSSTRIAALGEPYVH
jgi:hypothetical protein